MFTINTFSIPRLNNAEFTGFMINLQKAITTSDSTKLGLSTVLPSFGSTLQKLIDQVYNSNGSEFTAIMQEQDDRRIQIFRRIRLRLQVVLYAETNPQLIALQTTVQTHLLNKYATKISQMAYHAKTAVIQGFLYDINDKLGDDGISALGISDDVMALEEANNAFITAYNSRSAERASGDTGVTVKLRQEMFALYQQICFTTQYLANTIDETLADKAKACQDFIAVLNVILVDAKKRYLQRLANGTDEDDIEEGTDENTDNGGNGGNGSGEGDGGGTNHGSNQNTEDEGGSNSGSGDNGSGGSGSGSNSGSDSGSNSGSGSNPSLPSDATNGSNSSEGGDNTTDPNKPSENGVVNGDEVSF